MGKLAGKEVNAIHVARRFFDALEVGVLSDPLEELAAQVNQVADAVCDGQKSSEEPKVDPLITLPGIGKALSGRLKEAGVFTLEQ